MKTPLDICNLALSKLAESPIPAIDPNGCPAARQCYLHYHPARREVLCAYRWGFAQEVVKLASSEVDDRGDDGKLSKHKLPFDCLRVLSVNQPRWTLRGRSIYTHEPIIKLLYTCDCEEVDLFEPLFIEAFAAKLASKMCIVLTNDSALKERLNDEYAGSKKGGLE